jgi:outer membrane protein assembly factor BamD
VTARSASPGLGQRWPRLAVLAGLAGLLAGCGASTIPAVHSEPERLTLGRRALLDREYNVALELLKSYVANNAGGADVDLAIEMLGEANLRIKEWAEAQTQFERVLRDYPESDSAATASFLLAEALWGQSRGPAYDQEFTRKALEQYQTYLGAYPGHRLNGAAEMSIQRAYERLASKLVEAGNLYVKLQRTGPAREYFRRALEEYPTTAAAAGAELGLALADARDGKLDEAMTALRALQARHGGQPAGVRAGKELARLERQARKKK